MNLKPKRYAKWKEMIPEGEEGEQRLNAKINMQKLKGFGFCNNYGNCHRSPIVKGFGK